MGLPDDTQLAEAEEEGGIFGGGRMYVFILLNK